MYIFFIAAICRQLTATDGNNLPAVAGKLQPKVFHCRDTVLFWTNNYLMHFFKEKLFFFVDKIVFLFLNISVMQ